MNDLEEDNWQINNKEDKSKFPEFITANLHNYKFLKEIRKGLKDNPTDTEKLIWKYLRNKQTAYKIHRQRAIDRLFTN